MSGKRLCVAMVVVATLLAVSALAQDEKNEVGGILGRTFTQNDQLIYGGTNPGKSTTSAVIEAGFGLYVKVWRKLSIRMDVRDFWAGQPDFPLAPTGNTRQHNIFVGGGAFWRF
jgi:hypothetical protein